MGLAFVSGIVLLFGALLAFENQAQGQPLALRPAGLLTWLVSGNWPAKVGAGLLIISTGALLRYLMINIEWPPSVKLLSGVAMSAALGLGSGALRASPRLRAVHLALAGASLGVAYLTAYSAYGVFRLVGEAEALGGLFIVASAGTLFAVASRAVSIAALAMVGAFIAPAFALTQPEPAALLQYYLLASCLVLFMVWRRGWRPLIHLSFLFTLAGGAFFGWMQGLYVQISYDQAHPLLLLSIALHLAMPFAEPADTARQPLHNRWLHRFDMGYFLLLPLAALALTLAGAAQVRPQSAIGLAELGLMWLVAAGVQQWRFRAGTKRFLAVASLFLCLAALLWLDNLPYFLIGAVVACALLAAGPRGGVPEELEGVLSAAGLACAAGYLLDALSQPVAGQPLLNPGWLRNIVLAAALTLAGIRLRQQGSRLAVVFITIASTWFFVCTAREVARLNLQHFPQIAYLALLAATLAYAVSLVWRQPGATALRLLVAAHFFGGFLSVNGFPAWALLPLMLAGHAVFSLTAWLAERHAEGGAAVAGEARSALPLLLLPWAIAYSQNQGQGQFAAMMVLLVCSALSASLQGQLSGRHAPAWPNPLSPLGLVLATAYLLFQTLIHIERSPWAVAYELLALLYLWQSLRAVQGLSGRDIQVFKAVGLFAALSVVLANILRGFGPAGVLNILDFNRLLLPAVVSLLLAGAGALLAWLSAGYQSRRMWAIGTAVLACAALKLVLLDFGSLGQLGNILAMMGAGAIFLLVAWLVPIPPRAAETPAEEAAGTASGPHEPQAAADLQADFQDTQPSVLEPMPAAAMAAHASAPAVAGVTPAQGTAASTESLERVRARLQRQRETAAASGGNRWMWLLLGLLLFAIYANHALRHRKPAAPSVVVAPAPQAAPQVAAEPLHPAITHVRPRLTESTATLSQAATAAAQLAAPPLPPVAPACAFPGVNLSGDFAVLAAGAYSGRRTDMQIDQSGHAATQIDVIVHRTDKPVVLMLGAYEPTIWNIARTPNTRIAGVLASGYHRQAVAGLEPSVPVLEATYDNKSACGYFYVNTDNLRSINPLSQRLFQRNVDMVYPAQNGSVTVSDAGFTPVNLVRSNAVTPESFRDRNAPLAGMAGLDDGVRKGLLRNATQADLDAWASAAQAQANARNNLPPVAGQVRAERSVSSLMLIRAYVVQQAYTYPAGLWGGNLATFIIPRGVPRPSGNPGHSMVLDYNTLSCQGPGCAGGR